MTRLRPLAGLAVLALVAAACGGGGDTADSTSTTSTTSTTTTVARTTTTTSSSSSTTTTEPPPTIRQPLTGEPVDSEDDIIQRAAQVVKIDNNPSAVPNHSGLAVADIVYEELVEGRTTRFAAVFHSRGSDPIGPIRSGRTQDVDLFTSYNEPLFVWSGGNGRVTAAIDQSSLVNLGPNRASGYFRGPGSAPHNLYNTTDRIWEQTPEGHPGPPPQQFEYLDEDEEFEGDPTGGVEVMVGAERIEWFWNEEFGTFDRAQRGRLHVDDVHGQIRATNVIVMGVQYLPSPAYRPSPEAQTIGAGQMYVFTDGEVILGRWSRDSADVPIEYTEFDGTPIELQPGNTWIELAERVEFPDGNSTVEVTLLPPG
jgi:hypothetical protein